MMRNFFLVKKVGKTWGKPRENPGKTRGKPGENPGKTGENRGKPGKTGENRGKPGKTGENRGIPGKTRLVSPETFVWAVYFAGASLKRVQQVLWNPWNFRNHLIQPATSSYFNSVYYSGTCGLKS